jgi:hypothetical protein
MFMACKQGSHAQEQLFVIMGINPPTTTIEERRLQRSNKE